MDWLRTELRKIGSVVKQPAYLAAGVAAAGLTYLFFALSLNYGLLWGALSGGQFDLFLSLVPPLVKGYPGMITSFSLLMSVLISLALGLNVAVALFRLIELSEIGRQGVGSIFGMGLAVLAPACTACATAVFAVAGMTSLFALLPFNGIEIKMLAFMSLLGSIIWTSRQIDQEVCELCQI
jgi:hypothetical protein